MKIAVLLTCHNRCAKTVSCLNSLKTAISVYNSNQKETVNIEIFLTDDGCTDDTISEARHVFLDEKVLHIIHGDGNLYWAGGMRVCWREAMERDSYWDYYLLLNDDVELMPDVFDELFSAEKYALNHSGKEGVVSGITCAKNNPNLLTYSGEVWTNKFLGRSKRLNPTGMPQLCDLTNANILLVPGIIVDKIGIFYEGYHHGQADYDYSHKARKAGFLVIVTAHFCGRCDRDHMDSTRISEKIMSMSLSERRAYFDNPVHSNRDYLRFFQRTSPFRVPLVWIGRKLNLYFPKLYYYLSNKRQEL